MPQPIVVKRYKNQRAYQVDAVRMAKRGYEVANTVSEVQRSGCLRTLLFGFLFPPKPQLIVTYRLI